MSTDNLPTPSQATEPRLVMKYGTSTIVVSTEHLRQFRRAFIRTAWFLVAVLAVLMPGSVFSRLLEILPHAWK